MYKKNYRGWNLEIDRKDSNLEYRKENCVMAAIGAIMQKLISLHMVILKSSERALKLCG